MAKETGVAPLSRKEPRAAQLYFVPRLMQPVQVSLVRALRGYFVRAPGWVLLTTIGRKSGLPREVLLPCERTNDGLYVISTYGGRSNWIQNLRANPEVRITSAGETISARAHVLEDVAAKQALVTAHPFFVPMPIGVMNLLHRTVLRWPTAAFLRWWVRGRPVVVIRPI